MKYLLVMIVVGVAIWLLLRGRRAGERRDAAPSRRDAAAQSGGRELQPMIACEHCGVHLPRDDALVDAQARRYCCEGHRALGPR